jgi:uncharacterized protein (TIGR03067 family)
MWNRLLLAALCGLVLSPSSPALADEPSKLDGTWVEVVPRLSREDHPGYRITRSPMTLVIDGDLYLAKSGDRVFRRSLIKHIPGQTPEAVDLMTVVGGEFWLTRAIFKVDGDTLTIKEGALDHPRPTDFTPWEFNGQNSKDMGIVYVYKRRSK